MNYIYICTEKIGNVVETRKNSLKFFLYNLHTNLLGYSVVVCNYCKQICMRLFL